MTISNYFTGLQHIGMPTQDLEKTIKFYQSLGFTAAGLFHNDDSRCAFMKFGNLVIETWEGDSTGHSGAINHFSLNTTDIDKAFEIIKAGKFELIDSNIQSIKTFWDNGIRYFNILGPNKEIIEFCQIL